MHVLGRESYVTVRVCQFFQIRDRVLAYIRLRSGVFRDARAGGANGVINFFLNRAIRFAWFDEDFLDDFGRYFRRVVHVRCYAFAAFRFTLKRLCRAM